MFCLHGQKVGLKQTTIKEALQTLFLELLWHWNDNLNVVINVWDYSNQ